MIQLGWGLSSWLLATQASVLCHVDFFIGQLTTWQLHQSKQARTPELARARKTEIPVLCNLTSEMKSHHFPHIPFARSKSLGPAALREKMQKGYQEAAVTGSHSKAAYHAH